MRIDLNARTAIELDKNALIKLPRSRGDSIICTRGLLWVTEDNCPHDIALKQGERYISKGAGAVIVNAFEASTFRVVAREARRGLIARIAYQIASVWRGIHTETLVAR
ncbi:MAG: DUF2917 domain-containing protein [Burkholderiales bacterium]